MTLSRNLRRAATAILVSATAIAFAGAAHAQPINAMLGIGHEANPDDLQDFTYVISGQTSATAQLDDDAAATGGDGVLGKDQSFPVIAGDYTITQTNPGPGWVLDGINCNTPSQIPNLANRNVSLNVAAGAQITCKFLNRRVAAPPTGKVVIQKQVSPTHAQDFNFLGTGPNNWNQPFQLDDDIGASGANNQFPKTRAFDVPAGSYTFKEIPTNGWTLTKIECSPAANAAINLNGHSAQINVVAGQTTTCYFTNKQNNAEIRIIKDAVPDSTQDFLFSATGPNFSQNVTLDDDANVSGGDAINQNSKAWIVPAGQYTLSELPNVPGWVLTNIDCSPSGSPIPNMPAGKVTITAAAGQTVTCKFNNKKSSQPPCTSPMTATVNFFLPGWQSVTICKGGTVTFKKSVGNAFTVAPSVPTGSFAPVSLGAGSSTGTTSPFPIPGTYKYWSIAAVPQGTIIVLP